ncbi:MAG: hypothetical protein EOP87_09195 [Verrucomicrobiaceae bacterium]|nr:MAG: hypothetical protein EOP87_09195 [Verrucomicrobiaceae bacterium]
MKRPFALVVVIAAFSLHLAAAKEILIHAGPVVTTPDAILLDPALNPEQKGKDLKFIYEFFVDAKLLHKGPGAGADPTVIPAVKAAELAARSVEPRLEDSESSPNRVELLEHGSGSNRVRYYLVTIKVDDSTETHRIVLMDGTVLKPRLRRLTEE